MNERNPQLLEKEKSVYKYIKHSSKDGNEKTKS